MECYRRRTLVVLGSLFGTAGCISFGSPSVGRIEAESSSREYAVSIEVSTPDDTVVAGTQSLRPNEAVEEAFELERGAEYDVSIEFDPALRAVEVTDSAAERGWTYESGTVRGDVGFSSEDQVYTVSVDDAGVATIEYDAVSAP